MKPYLDPEEQHSILLGNTSPRASLAASASAAMALCSCTGSRTSLLHSGHIVTVTTCCTVNSHLHPFHFDSPGVGTFIQGCLHPLDSVLMR
ncbi:hypothetical protein LAZ67_3002388 [Cordylochernes scorpioides]|uniref:Uncharacterized protein n=1 Tax=Cordylochernes scorpioides TaxID=51811 RepID=A0ABY6KB43_9ARAC|nr:hypothetical protein LAZ67_3002388 [Cordylochernes scorpioides]